MNKDTNREIPKRDHLVNKSSTVLIIKMEKYIFFSLHTVFTSFYIMKHSEITSKFLSFSSIWNADEEKYSSK